MVVRLVRRTSQVSHLSSHLLSQLLQLVPWLP
jgi:hypothetical protein